MLWLYENNIDLQIPCLRALQTHVAHNNGFIPVIFYILYFIFYILTPCGTWYADAHIAALCIDNSNELDPNGQIGLGIGP